MANKRIDQLPKNTNALKDSDLIPIWDVVNSKTESVSLGSLSSFVNTTGDTKSIKKSLTTSQITGLTTSVEIIPAPGDGKAIQILAANARVLFNTTAFSPGAALDIEYSTNPGVGATTYWGRWTAGLWVGQTTDRYGCFFQNTVTGGAEDIWAPNDAVVLTATANQTSGDGTIDVYITYRIINL